MTCWPGSAPRRPRTRYRARGGPDWSGQDGGVRELREPEGWRGRGSGSGSERDGGGGGTFLRLVCRAALTAGDAEASPRAGAAAVPRFRGGCRSPIPEAVAAGDAAAAVRDAAGARPVRDVAGARPVVLPFGPAG